MRTALPAITTTALLITLAVRLHRAEITRARTDGYLTACRDVRRGILTAPKGHSANDHE